MITAEHFEFVFIFVFFIYKNMKKDFFTMEIRTCFTSTTMLWSLDLTELLLFIYNNYLYTNLTVN